MLMLVLLAVCAGLCSPAALRCESCGAMPPLQVACESLGPPKKGGRVIGVDLQETKRPDKFCDDRVTIVQVSFESCVCMARSVLRRLAAALRC